jgi:hypothetical protein
VVGAGAVVCAVVAGFYLARRSVTDAKVTVETAVATALVAPASADLYREENLGSRIATLKGGTQVNVLRIPSARDQVSIPVQSVVPEVLSPGYMRTSDLERWDSEDSTTKQALIGLFPSGGPPEPGGDGGKKPGQRPQTSGGGGVVPKPPKPKSETDEQRKAQVVGFLEKAQGFLDEGRLEDAKTYADKVLRIDNGNKQARDLQDRITAKRELEMLR